MSEQKYKEPNEVTLDDILDSFPADPTEETEEDKARIPEEIVEETADTENMESEAVRISEDGEITVDGLGDSDEEADDNALEPDEFPEDEYEEPEYEREYKPKRRKRRRSGAGKLIFGLCLAAVIIGVSVFLATSIIRYSKELMGLNKSDTEIHVDIPYGSNTTQIAQILRDEGIIDEPWLFSLFSKIRGTDGSYVSGVHRLAPNMSYGDIVEELVKVVEEVRDAVDVVFPEGINILEAARRLEEKGVCSAEEFIRVFNTSEFGFDFEEHIENKPLKFYLMEGYLFPDTYTFYVNEDPVTVAKKIYRNFQARLTPDIYGRMNDLGLTLEETLTLASIVQAEVPFKSDMRTVASVFWNRLNNPEEYPLLQSDPTRKYVREVITPNVEIRSDAMFKAYDTYQGDGLPPGPVCNPGLDAINAVLYPAETDYYYFCANIETRETFYAKTLAEHEENLVKAGIVIE